MTPIKALFFDVDGTLVSFNTHRIPESTKQAIRAAQARGIKVFVATGRHYRYLNNLEDLTFDGFLTVNGSICMIDGEIVHQHPIAAEDIAALKRYQEEVQAFPCGFVQEDQLYLNFLNDDAEEALRLLNFPEVPTMPLRNIPDKPVYQLVAFFRKCDSERIMSVMPNSVETRWCDYFADVIARGSNKAVGISKVIERLGIAPEEIVAFGDGENDIEMLQYAGVGVAMGNASEKTKAAADFVTRTVDEDGIAYAIDRLVLNR